MVRGYRLLTVPIPRRKVPEFLVSIVPMLHIRTMMTSIAIVTYLSVIAMSLRTLVVVYSRERIARQLSRSLRLVLVNEPGEQFAGSCRLRAWPGEE